MAPKLDIATQQKRLQERADQLAWKQDYTTAVGILKTNPTILGLTKQYMITKGWWPGAAMRRQLATQRP